MENENIAQPPHRVIEARLADATELEHRAEEALLDAAGLLCEAEARLVLLLHPGLSDPPPAH
jgi:hypothetical protein